MGLYLPFELDSAIMVGGIIAWLVSRYQSSRGKNTEEMEGGPGLLFASGLITGEALIGIFLAIPVAITKDDRVLALVENSLPSVIGLIVVLGICYWLYQVGKKELA
ncbi:MAG: OPT/YSL family transporter [Saprospiraceae bacterium]